MLDFVVLGGWPGARRRQGQGPGCRRAGVPPHSPDCARSARGPAGARSARSDAGQLAPKIPG